MQVNPELFLVAELNCRLGGTVMGGYEGHRGWINYLAVHPDCQGHGVGRSVMEAIEAKLLALGCPKINLQVRKSNTAVIQFYGHLGYHIDDVISLGKRLIQDEGESDK
jgi:ribosomal protein S18 acetylase RimI-like enzyme